LVRAFLDFCFSMGATKSGEMNPLRHLGSLTIFFFWIVLVTGIWLFIFFRTSVDGAYESVEYLTHNQWYIGGVMRSLHRYASDAAVVTLVLHIAREFALDRYRGKRWFSWITGVPLLWMVIPLGITGYWLVWDELAQYIALASAELLDALPIFTDSMARNFLSDEALSNRFFTLMAFLHLIGLPLFLVFGIWLHVLRINGPEVNPPRLLMSGSLLAMLLLSLVFPALSQGQADLAKVPGALAMDWFYLLIYPLIGSWSLEWVWFLLVGVSVLIACAPWLPPQRPKRVAEVNLDFCNGCERCVADCPFGALTMVPRSDGKAFEVEVTVDPDLCISCGICVGSCPTATPFRTRGDLLPGIDLPDHSMAELRQTLQQVSAKLQGKQRVIVFTCESGNSLQSLTDHQTAVVSLVCMGQLPPPFMDYILSRDLADGILLTGCGPEACQYRFGADWTGERIHRQRDPQLRKRVSGELIAMGWEHPWSQYNHAEMLSRFRQSLQATPAETPVKTRERNRVAGWSRQAVAYSVFAILVGLFSVWPKYRLLSEDEAVVSLTFSHAGQRLQECRRFTQQELQELPPNMRKPDECPRGRHPVEVSFSVDGEEVYRSTHLPSGIWSDGASTVYQRLKMPSGTHLLQIRMRDSGRTVDFDFDQQQSLELVPGQNVVVEFDQTQQEFIFR
jgi:quinol-cytochrome oxidoreductase complex cytochrome b subunit/coenzyme F420-reducing hydrogenase delta subunit